MLLGMFFGLIIGLIFSLTDDKKFCEKPNQGIEALKNKTLIIALIFSLSGMLILPLISLFIGRDFDWITSVIFCLLFGLFISFFTLGQDLIHHLTLRLILCQQGLIPRNYADFLDYAAERKLIQRIGGQYRFLHDSLRKHFAPKEQIPERIIQENWIEKSLLGYFFLCAFVYIFLIFFLVIENQ